ncbi:methyltransferase [Hirsutella rhossiliensis]|uniref:Methyltransferase domain-containing protein n=1 Tax=Hirsutella rhossiliensis TaxID=111463 RepID=A0A9P8SIB3_9HYPO|nr:methyltransferase domain-containing protein [Hirsutella rhossiliensis]KAH0962435.1 methyltransferase domain-containing protein [Hirsutella rhossiliensis]
MPHNPMASQHQQQLQGFWAHGRFYGGWRPRKYPFPIDAEELNRLDLFHKFFLVARKEAVCGQNLNFGRPARVLDLGTGTGIWAINLAEELEQLPEIMAVDLNLVQPALIPRGMVTVQFDIEEPSWDSLMWDCDLVHVRMLFGSIQTDLWPSTYRKIFEHLTPGTGVLEHVEIDWVPRWESSGDFPENSAFKEWSDAYHKALDLFNRSARVSTQQTRLMIEQAGFCDFREQTVRCYVNPWSSDTWEKDTARWFNLGMKHGLEAISLMPMVERLGMTVEEVNDLCARVKEENTKLRYHGYCTV